MEQIDSVSFLPLSHQGLEGVFSCYEILGDTVCGILGVVSAEVKESAVEAIRDALSRLFIRSESRGGEASGLATLGISEILIHRAALPASKMVASADFRRILASRLKESVVHTAPFVAIGHARLVTNGL